MEAYDPILDSPECPLLEEPPAMATIMARKGTCERHGPFVECCDKCVRNDLGYKWTWELSESPELKGALDEFDAAIVANRRIKACAALVALFDRQREEIELPKYELIEWQGARNALADALDNERRTVERLRDANAALVEANRDRIAEFTAAFSALERLKAEQMEDTKRLDWLEANPGVITPENAVSPDWNMEGFHDEEEGWGSDELGLWCPTLRSAIDKARRLSQPDTGDDNG